MSSLVLILTHLVTVTKKSPRPGYAQRDFDQLYVELECLGLGNIAQKSWKSTQSWSKEQCA